MPSYTIAMKLLKLYGRSLYYMSLAYNHAPSIHDYTQGT